ARDERGKLVPADRDPLACRRDLILADRGPGSPDGRTLHPPERVGHDDEREVDVPELGKRRDPVQAERFAGERQREQNDADDLAERVHYARSTARWPRRPRGRITSTRKRRPNANASRSSASSAGRNTSAAISPIPRM